MYYCTHCWGLIAKSGNYGIYIVWVLIYPVRVYVGHLVHTACRVCIKLKSPAFRYNNGGSAASIYRLEPKPLLSRLQPSGLLG